jgi:hypothetical protein
LKLLIYFFKIFNARLNLSGIEQMIILRGGFERITLQLGNIKNNAIIFLILNIKISFAINSYRKHLYHVGCVSFCLKRKTNKKNARENALRGWNDVAVWKDFKPPYIPKNIWQNIFSA